MKSEILHDISYVRLLNAVVVDKILNGKNQIIRSYLGEKKELILTNPEISNNESIDKLLSIRRKKLSV